MSNEPSPTLEYASVEEIIAELRKRVNVMIVLTESDTKTGTDRLIRGAWFKGANSHLVGMMHIASAHLTHEWVYGPDENEDTD